MDKKDKQVKVYNTNMTKEEKAKALDEAIKGIEKTFGKGAIMTLTDTKVAPVESLPTGCLSIDLALGIGGLPRGRIVEIYGPESSATGQRRAGIGYYAETRRECCFRFDRYRLGCGVDA